MLVQFSWREVSLVKIIGPDRVEGGDITSHPGHEGSNERSEPETEQTRWKMYSVSEGGDAARKLWASSPQPSPPEEEREKSPPRLTGYWKIVFEHHRDGQIVIGQSVLAERKQIGRAFYVWPPGPNS